jgi:hypothetical protein
LLGALGLFTRAEGAAYRDELTFLAKTRFLFREYALVVPLDVKRQPLPRQVFVEIKALGAWRWESPTDTSPSTSRTNDRG